MCFVSKFLKNLLSVIQVLIFVVIKMSLKLLNMILISLNSEKDNLKYYNFFVMNSNLS